MGDGYPQVQRSIEERLAALEHWRASVAPVWTEPHRPAGLPEPHPFRPDPREGRGHTCALCGYGVSSIVVHPTVAEYPPVVYPAGAPESAAAPGRYDECGACSHMRATHHATLGCERDRCDCQTFSERVPAAPVTAQDLADALRQEYADRVLPDVLFQWHEQDGDVALRAAEKRAVAAEAALARLRAACELSEEERGDLAVYLNTANAHPHAKIIRSVLDRITKAAEVKP